MILPIMDTTMKAIICSGYGAPDQLELKEVDKPVPKKGEVLVKIHATAINDYDWSMVRGKPYVYRLMYGLYKPKNPIPGMELSGTIEALGAGTQKFNVGDDVYGDTSSYGFGSFAEYMCIDEHALFHKPVNMTFEEAASVSHASMLAVQGLIDIGMIRQGQKILINGAGGGVGSFGLQLAKQYNAEVTGVDTGNKLEIMKSIGFDHIIDYKKEDFTKSDQLYDMILDCKTNRPPSKYLRVLKENGKYITVGGQLTKLLQLLISKWQIAKFTTKSVHIVALKPNKDLDFINRLFEEGKIKPVLDVHHGLHHIPKLIEYFGQGKHTGKIVVTISDRN